MLWLIFGALVVIILMLAGSTLGDISRAVVILLGLAALCVTALLVVVGALFWIDFSWFSEEVLAYIITFGFLGVATWAVIRFVWNRVVLPWRDRRRLQR